MKSGPITVGKVKIDHNYLAEDFTYNSDFFVMLYNVTIQLAKLLYQDVIRIKSNAELIHKVLIIYN